MALTIKTNIASLIAQGSLTSSTNKLNQAIERMTTGYKINHASDNAANYSISTNMTTRINAYQVAEDNVSMGLDFVQTASSTLESMGDLTIRLRALATQAQNGTYGSQSINALTKEANSIVSELNRLQTTAEYNGIKLFSNQTDGALKLLDGGSKSNSSQQTELLSAEAGGIALMGLNIGKAEDDDDPSGGTSSGRPIIEPENTTKFIKIPTIYDGTIDMKLAEVDENTEITSGTYSISTAEELAKLATMTNNGKIGKDARFVLMNDIDLSKYSSGEGWTPIGDASHPFEAIFGGNGFTISNLTTKAGDSGLEPRGLFGFTKNASIGDLGLEKCNVDGGDTVGALVASAEETWVLNCYANGKVSGVHTKGGLIGVCESSRVYNSYADVNISIPSELHLIGSNTGGVIGYAEDVELIGCFSKGKVVGTDSVGGLVGNMKSGTIIESYSMADVKGTSDVGGLIGYSGCNSSIEMDTSSQIVVARSYSMGKVSLINSQDDSVAVGAVCGRVSDWVTFDCKAYFLSTTGQTRGIGKWSGNDADATMLITMEKLESAIAEGILPQYQKDELSAGGELNLVFQVGVGANESSQIGLTIQGVDLSALENLDLQSADAFDILDGILSKINEQQTKLGATENRLMSALDEISTQYENLVSSRSTLRDADIADVSSEYIKMQILQQASATLLSTANQTPALALQLL